MTLLKSYYELCKPNVVYMMLICAFVGMLLAEESVSSFWYLFVSLSGIAFCAASAAAINPIVNNPATGDAQTVTLVITNGGLFVGSPLVYNGKWAGGTAPVLNESGIDIISIMTIDNGVTNYCFLNGEKMT